MIVSVMVTRTPAQRVRARASWWAVRRGTNDLAVVEWDPAGQLTAKQACEEALRRLLVSLEGSEPPESS